MAGAFAPTRESSSPEFFAENFVIGRRVSGTFEPLGTRPTNDNLPGLSDI